MQTSCKCWNIKFRDQQVSSAILFYPLTLSHFLIVFFKNRFGKNCTVLWSELAEFKQQQQTSHHVWFILHVKLSGFSSRLLFFSLTSLLLLVFLVHLLQSSSAFSFLSSSCLIKKKTHAMPKTTTPQFSFKESLDSWGIQYWLHFCESWKLLLFPGKLPPLYYLGSFEIYD